MRVFGIILGAVVAGLAAYVLYGLATGGGTAQAATNSGWAAGPKPQSVMTKTAASNAAPFVDNSGGKLGIDAVTGKPFKPNSLFASITTGKIPFKVDYGTKHPW